MDMILGWLNDQLLKMIWLQQLVEWFFGELLDLDPSSIAFSTLTFFVYDVIKIFILLIVLIFLASYIQSYFSPEKTKVLLSKVNGFWANVLGALLGTLTPFCSCSSIPIFIGFTKAGLPIGVTFSFLISSPLVDLASVILLASIFNWTVALAYVLVGLLIAILGGSLISELKMERYVESFVMAKSTPRVSSLTTYVAPPLSFKHRVREAWDQVLTIIHQVWPYILVGLGIGALIHGVIPQAWIESVLGSNNPFSVLMATLVGIPMYADIFGALPIAEALVAKGVEIGTVLAFMMAVTALSLPSLIMIKKVMKIELLLTFVAIITAGIVIMGYAFNGLGQWFM